MTKKTKDASEAGFEAAMHAVTHRVFPWLPAGAVKHQLTLSLKFGLKTIHRKAADTYVKQGRADILIENEQPLALLELKRPGLVLTADDQSQALSYASVLRPMPPLTIISNGDETIVLETYSGKPLDAVSTNEAQFSSLVQSAAKAAKADTAQAIATLMGSDPDVWRDAVRQVTSDALAELTGSTRDGSRLPFADALILPRKVTAILQYLLKNKQRLTVLEGAPLSGKSNVLRELVRAVPPDKAAALYILARPGVSVFEVIADAFSAALGWPATAVEVRHWLMRVSHQEDNALVVLIDQVDDDSATLIRDVEALTSATFGDGVRVVLACDDAARLIKDKSRRRGTPIGRRAQVLSLGPLDDQEFEVAAEALAEQHIHFTKGAEHARELRQPWVLRLLRDSIVATPRYTEGLDAAVLPPLLSIELIAHARLVVRDVELRRDFQTLAKAVLDDYQSPPRDAELALLGASTYLIRDEILRVHLDTARIETMVSAGYLKLTWLDTAGPVYVVRIPELLASELADLMGRELAQMAQADAAAAARWLTDAAASLCLGDIVAAQAVHDAALSHGGVPLKLIDELVRIEPQIERMEVGFRGETVMDGERVAIAVEREGEMIVTVGGKRHVIDTSDEEGAMYGDTHAWLTLSHLAGRPFVGGVEGAEHGKRYDPLLLLEIGRASMVLRDFAGPMKSFLTHRIPEGGEFVCHSAGIIEPITLSMMKYLSNPFGDDVDAWFETAVKDEATPLIARLQIALSYLAMSADEPKARWARSALKRLPDPFGTGTNSE